MTPDNLQMLVTGIVIGVLVSNVARLLFELAFWVDHRDGNNRR